MTRRFPLHPRFVKALLRPLSTVLTAALPVIIALSGEVRSQTQNATQGPPAFKSISFDFVALRSQARPKDSITMSWAPLEYKEGRLTGLDHLHRIIEFACSDLLSPYRMEPNGRGQPVQMYRIDATVPSGTAVDGVRAMLRRFLGERLHFRYHLADRETPIYTLLRGPGDLKLDPPRPTPPGPYRGEMWLLNSYAQPIGKLAEFLSVVARRDVVDKTGIEGLYSFEIDWRDEFRKSPTKSEPGLAQSGAARFGLKLEHSTEVQKYLIVDHVETHPLAGQ